MQSCNACRFCGAKLQTTFVDLGKTPLCETFLNSEALGEPESFYPLHALVCGECFLVQLPEHVSPPEIYRDYPYFSSFSSSWVAHARDYCASIVDELRLDASSLVVEVASNDGYLLQHFVEREIPCVGIEPAENVALVAREKGITTETAFLGREVADQFAQRHGLADLVIANNVLAHVPDINDFIQALKMLLGPEGRATLEFPHLLCLMREIQFDTIYHEHFSYLSLFFVEQAFARWGLRVFDVEEIPTHGGSLRVHVAHSESNRGSRSERMERVLADEVDYGLRTLDVYGSFGRDVVKLKNELLLFLITAKKSGKKVVGYGAPGKGNTLLNYCGIRSDLLEYTVDISPHKQGLYTPGTHIPIYSPDKIFETKPDYLLILPWNLATEITQQMHAIRAWDGKFVTPVPKITVH